MPAKKSKDPQHSKAPAKRSLAPPSSVEVDSSGDDHQQAKLDVADAKQRLAVAEKDLADAKKDLADAKKSKDKAMILMYGNQVTAATNRLTELEKAQAKRPRDGDSEEQPNKSRRTRKHEATPPTVVELTHRPRFVHEVSEKWKDAASIITRGKGKLDLRVGWIMHFFGESGAGKSKAATNDTVLALHKLGVKDVGRIHATLTHADDGERFKHFGGELNETSKTKRNDAAQKWLEELLHRRPVSNQVILVVVDEHQVSIPLCRGLCARLQDVMDNLYRMSGQYILLVFAGLARGDVNNTHHQAESVSTDGTKVHKQLVQGWPSLKKNFSDLDVAAQFVQHHIQNKGKEDSQDSASSDYDENVTAASLQSEQVVELLRMAAGNIAAVTVIAEYLADHHRDLKQVTNEIASKVHRSAVDGLLARNSNKGNKWKKNKQLAPIAQQLFDGAVLGKVPTSTADVLAPWGLLTFAGSGGHVSVTVNGFYWSVLVDVVLGWQPDPFAITPDNFERLGMEWLRCRAIAFRRLLGRKSVSLRELIPGCRLQANVPLPDPNSMLSTFKTSDKLEEGTPDTVAQGKQTRVRLEPPLFLINGAQASFADGVAMLPSVAIFLQAKLSTNQVTRSGPAPEISASLINDERLKSGFDGHKLQKKGQHAYSKQRQLHAHVLNKVSGTAKQKPAAVFVFFTHKPAPKVNQHDLMEDTVLVCQENFEEMVPAFSRIALRLIAHDNKGPSTLKSKK